MLRFHLYNPYKRFIRQLISRLKGNGNYTFIHLKGGLKSFLVSQTLKRFESQSPHFIRISKSIMVNPNDVDQIVRETAKVGYVRLINGLCLLISRRRLGETRARLGYI